MRAPARLALPLVAALILVGCSSSPDVASPTTIATQDPVLGPPVRLDVALSGFDRPVLLTHDGIDGVVYVVEQGGRIWRVEGDERALFVDVSNETAAGGERGLLGMAWDPEGERAYVSYTDTRGDSVLERVGRDGAREVLLQVAQPFGNHNGGHVTFGPDGFLYYGLGDGGSGGDPQGNGQDKDALLGSLLRLDVSGAEGHRIPADNPYGTEVWAKGLRNPWRFSFDRANGDLYVADVGQSRVEEVNHVAAGRGAGANFGWNVYEGTSRYTPFAEPFSEPIFPVATYTHDDGCSITGGYVYRGVAQPQLEGIYFFADYCSGKLWGMRQGSGALWNVIELLDTELAIVSFGEDAQGELYVVAHGGSIHRIVATGAELPSGLAPR